MHRQSRMAERLKVAAASSNASRARGTVAVHPNRLADLQRAIGNQAVKGLTDSIGLASGIYSDVLRSPGQPLPPAVQADMEGRFDQDFSNVQIHLGEEAERSAAEMSANAYTRPRQMRAKNCSRMSLRMSFSRAEVALPRPPARKEPSSRTHTKRLLPRHVVTARYRSMRRAGSASLGRTRRLMSVCDANCTTRCSGICSPRSPAPRAAATRRKPTSR